MQKCTRKSSIYHFCNFQNKSKVKTAVLLIIMQSVHHQPSSSNHLQSSTHKSWQNMHFITTLQQTITANILSTLTWITKNHMNNSNYKPKGTNTTNLIFGMINLTHITCASLKSTKKIISTTLTGTRSFLSWIWANYTHKVRQ